MWPSLCILETRIQDEVHLHSVHIIWKDHDKGHHACYRVIYNDINTFDSKQITTVSQLHSVKYKPFPKETMLCQIDNVVPICTASTQNSDQQVLRKSFGNIALIHY